MYLQLILPALAREVFNPPGVKDNSSMYEIRLDTRVITPQPAQQRGRPDLETPGLKRELVAHLIAYRTVYTTPGSFEDWTVLLTESGDIPTWSLYYELQCRRERLERK